MKLEILDARAICQLPDMPGAPGYAGGVNPGKIWQQQITVQVRITCDQRLPDLYFMLKQAGEF